MFISLLFNIVLEALSSPKRQEKKKGGGMERRNKITLCIVDKAVDYEKNPTECQKIIWDKN